MKYPRRRIHYSTLVLAPLLLIGVTLFSHADCPDTDPRALKWLDRMAQSLRELPYEGVVTFSRGGDLEVMQISHAVENQQEYVVLQQLTGEAVSVRPDENPQECLHPGYKLLGLSSRFAGDDCGIASNYSLSLTNGSRVAGRPTVHINVRPRDMFRYGYLLALDEETGLLLKTHTLSKGGVTLERFQFANLRLGAPSVASNDWERRSETPHFAPQVAETTASDSWRIRWLPRGFTATDSEMPGSSRRTYTDGLAVFSVFVEPLAKALAPGEGVVRNGSTISYTRGVKLEGRSMLVTVVGEVPLNTARMVADSVIWAS